MKRVIIFCESYPQINNTLYVATHNCADCSITIVIRANHDLFDFFKVINEKLFHNRINIIYFESYQTWMAKASVSKIKKLLHLFPDIIRERRYLKGIYDKYFAELRGAQVFFSSRYFSSYTFYLLKKLSKANTLAYTPDPSYAALVIDKSTPKHIVDLASLIVLKLIFGRDITMGKLKETKFPCIPDKFMEKEVDKVIKTEEINEMMKDFKLSQFKIFDVQNYVQNYSVIYFDSSLAENDYITDEATFTRQLTQIFKVLSKYFSEREIALKYHPHYAKDKTRIKIGDVLEDFIPAELLYNENIKMYLGIFSNAIANVEKGLVVSLADLISFENEKFREELKERLIRRSRSEIIFPKSLDEFERILIDLKEQRI